MAVIYATLIIKGKKTFAQVPVKLQEQVRQVLIDLECEELIGEQCRNLLPGVIRYAIMRNTESQRAYLVARFKEKMDSTHKKGWFIPCQGNRLFLFDRR